MRLSPAAVLLLLVTVTVGVAALAQHSCNASTQRLLSRKKRYMVFPEGSVYLVGIAQFTKFIPQLLKDWNFIIFTDAAYPLPNNAKQLLRKPHRQRPKKKKYSWYDYNRRRWQKHRRQRRDLYENLEQAMTLQGLNGTACVLRAVCEASQNDAPIHASDFLREALHLIFKLPDGPSQENQKYNLDNDCSSLAEECPFSLLDPINHNA